jgi:general secretion pathway protein D
LDINQEVSDVAETKTSGIDSPTIQQRKFQSTVLIEDGQTIALGGLIRDNRSRGKSGVPFLQRIPLLGAAFRSTTDINRRTELLIFITPHVIRNTQEAQEITNYLREKLNEAGDLSDKKK